MISHDHLTAICWAIGITCVGLPLISWALRRVLRWAESEVERHVRRALGEQAADWDEPTRAEVEADWLFDDPAFIDTSIDAEMRREEDAWLAASVLADIDDLPEVRHG